MTTGRYWQCCFDRYSNQDQLTSDGWSGLTSGNDGIRSGAAFEWHVKYQSLYNNTAAIPNRGFTVTAQRVQWAIVLPSNNQCTMHFCDNSANQQIYLRINTSNQTIGLYRGSTILASAYVPTLTGGTAQRIEMYATASLTSGVTEVRVEGQIISALSLTGKNTCNTGTAAFGRASANYVNLYEIAIDYEATADSPFNKARVYSGSFGTLNANTGTVVGSQDALGVLNTAARSTSNYIEWTGVGSIDAAVAPLSDFGDIVAVQMNPCMKSSNSGVVTAAVSMSDGTHTIAGDTVYPAASYTSTFPISSDTAPDGGAWTDAKVAALHGIIARTA